MKKRLIKKSKISQKETREPDTKIATVQKPTNEVWDCTVQEVMMTQDQSRKQPGFCPSFTKVQKVGRREDVCQTVNKAQPSAKL